jgi:hypothetical protein
MSSNLPPGVTESMLPGNRPEDAIDELQAEAIYNMIDAVGFDVNDGDKADRLVEALCVMLEIAHSGGYASGQQDTLMEQAQNTDLSLLVGLAIEFGYRQCEKGRSLGAALREAASLARTARTARTARAARAARTALPRTEG